MKPKEPKQKRNKKKRAKKTSAQNDDDDLSFLDEIIAANHRECTQQIEQAEAVISRHVDSVIELYKKRWSLVETYEDKMKEIKERSANNTLNMSIEEVQDWLGINVMNVELFQHTNQLPERKEKLPNGKYLDNQRTEATKFQTLLGACDELTGINISTLEQKAN